QPLAANMNRLLRALDFLGKPLPPDTTKGLSAAAADKDVIKIQKTLDPEVLAVVTLNPEARVKVARGPAKVTLQQSGYVPVIVKVVNDSTGTRSLRLASPQGGPIYSCGAAGDKGSKPSKDHFMDVEIYNKQPMTAELSGLKVEYAIGLLSSNEAGKREVMLVFDVGQGTQDLGFRAELPILFEIKPAIKV